MPDSVQATAHKDEETDFAPELSYALLAFNSVHLIPVLVNRDATGHGLLHMGLSEHHFNLCILRFLFLFGSLRNYKAWLL